MKFTEQHKKLERNITLLAVFAFVAVSIGGAVEIAPLFWIDNTIEKVKGVRPYTPLEQAGRDIYNREGCYVCHSQMIRPFRDEVERYGHYSLAAESIMPTYGFLAETDLDLTDASAKLRALSDVGVPYSKKDVADAVLDLKAQADPMADAKDLASRYPRAQQRDFDGNPARLTEMDALVAYLQVLGTMVDVNAAAAQEDLAKETGR